LLFADKAVKLVVRGCRFIRNYAKMGVSIFGASFNMEIVNSTFS